MAWKKKMVVTCAAAVAGTFFRAAPAHALTITPTFDSTITTDANAAAIEATINTAIGVYQSIFTDPITLTIQFQEMTSGLGESNYSFYELSYATVRSSMQTDATTPTDATALAHLPSGPNNPVTGSANMGVNTAEIKALNIPGGPYPSGLPGNFDGIISLNTAITFPPKTATGNNSSLLAVVEHEMDEVMGLGSGINSSDILPEDLFRYDSTGTRNYTTSGDNAYFSLDGTSDLARFNQNGSGDYGDWWSFSGRHIPQVQDAFSTALAAPGLGVEVLALDALGYNLAGNWRNAAGGVYQTAGNWSSAVPGSTDTAFFSTNATYTVTASAPITVHQITVTTGNVSLDSSAGALSANALVVAGGSISLVGSQVLYTIPTVLLAGGVTTLSADAKKILVTSNLTINAGNLDLTKGDLLLHSTSGNLATDDTTLQTYLNTGKIHSSLASATTGVALMKGSDYRILHGATATFNGQAVATTDLLVRYTYLGDATFDGQISTADYDQIDAGFLLGGFNGTTKIAQWINGDFNADGVVNYLDYALIDFAFQNQTAGTLASNEIAAHAAEFGAPYLAALDALSANPVPEPGALSLLVLVAIAPLFRRQRHAPVKP